MLNRISFKLCLTLFLSFFACYSANAQQMPPGGIIVNTTCAITHGHTVDEVMTVARAINYTDEGPNLVFYRRPMSGGNFPANFLLRTVYWDSVEHWANGTGPGSSGPRNHLAKLLECDNVNRSFWINRNVGQGNAYGGGENDEALMAARRCRMRPGSTMEQLYTTLSEINAPYAQQGDSTLLQFSQRFIGPSEGVDMGTLVTIRLVGEDAMGLARRLDSSIKYVGTPADSPVENCGDWVLFASHVAHFGQ